MADDEYPPAVQQAIAAGQDIWERLPSETDKGYAAFLIYRDMGPARSLKKTAAALGKHTHTFSQERTWSSRFGWRVRIAAWENEQERQRSLWVADERKKATERHVRTAQALQSKAIQALQTLQPAQMTPSEVIRFAEVAIRLERDSLNLNEPVDVNVHVTQHLDGMLPEDVVTRLRALRAEVDRRISDEQGMIEAEVIEDAEVVE